jgi:hypothetical protein
VKEVMRWSHRPVNGLRSALPGDHFNILAHRRYVTGRSYHESHVPPGAILLTGLRLVLFAWKDIVQFGFSITVLPLTVQTVMKLPLGTPWSTL